MQIRIPYHNANSTLSDIHTIDLIRAIFALSQCKIYERDGPKGTRLCIGEKLLETGRIHLKAQVVEGHYVLDVHFDSEQHRKRPRELPNGKSICRLDCPEVNLFVNDFVRPIILLNRTNYHYRMSDRDKWHRYPPPL
jgi:hypothetical protein